MLRRYVQCKHGRGDHVSRDVRLRAAVRVRVRGVGARQRAAVVRLRRAGHRVRGGRQRPRPEVHARPVRGDGGGGRSQPTAAATSRNGVFD